jgi:hypothetical protein
MAGGTWNDSSRCECAGWFCLRNLPENDLAGGMIAGWQFHRIHAKIGIIAVIRADFACFRPKYPHFHQKQQCAKTCQNADEKRLRESNILV